MKKIRVGVLMGGASNEREISLASGKMVAEHLPKDRYEVVLLDPLALMVGNAKLSSAMRDKAKALIAKGGIIEALPERDKALPASFQKEMTTAAATVLPATDAVAATGGDARIDVAFPVLHGTYGEDGTLQGMLDLIGIRYVGSGTLASALAMDKLMTKTVLEASGLPIARDLLVERRDFVAAPEDTAGRVGAQILPAVVKPVRSGSSIGMTIVHTRAEMGPALEEAFRYDDRALVEERLSGTELTVGVIGNRELTALPVIEIVTKREFFDYQAKYDPALTEEICPARVSDAIAREVQDLAMRAHRALGCRGLSRTDFIYGADGAVILEVNTMPGMTVNSLLPKAARVAGIPFGELLDRLVQLALEDE
ncbi:MAG: D-alanine--D-alanine ligase [Chloroflexi bacterium]|nr:MAG: D-alanine--D-alanine ligase [Chloroflexota bacterium]